MPAPRSISRRRFFAGAAASASLALLSGCVIAPVGPPMPHSGPDDGVDAPVGPPPAQYEVVPVAPAVGYVWIGGHWAWRAGRHVWIGGRWAYPPRGYYGWTPGYWGRRGPYHRWHGGYWRR